MKPNKLNILGLYIYQISFENAIKKVMELGLNYTSSYICFANVHMVIEAYQDEDFAQQVNNATMVLADGKPLTTACKILYNKTQERIAGMDFMPCLLKALDKGNCKVLFYGSTDDVLIALKEKIESDFKNIKIVEMISPPFRSLTSYEQETYIKKINEVAPQFVFVGLGCPKQEKWMYANYKQINAVLLGVGGAFSTVAGIQKRAPKWMQQLSLEWTYRLIQEPKRLFKRYFITNSMFVALLVTRLVKRAVNGIK